MFRWIFCHSLIVHIVNSFVFNINIKTSNSNGILIGTRLVLLNDINTSVIVSIITAFIIITNSITTILNKYVANLNGFLFVLINNNCRAITINSYSSNSSEICT